LRVLCACFEKAAHHVGRFPFIQSIHNVLEEPA
jgi:hypothetical protein